MKRIALALLASFTLGTVAEAGSVVALRTLRAQSVISPEDVTLAEETIPGAIGDLDQVIGLETRVAIYPGRPIQAGDLTPPAVVERNQMISLAYQRRGLSIMTEGRTLDRGAIGDSIRVMNVTSKSTVFATIGADGVAYVQSQ
ncbi:flagella basal body P-ring formation protein FlgA [Rhodobacter aestuarii]|uniref:Flagella basal body P-ring formation protein FlgA n=1 Tax=Rhodobacter aestuarii TaxID=453582 RepID=A0A1N7LLN8_9RHOB|nr:MULTISPECIES: flagellar basal body P-ring formation chaperone FlgA [Rhodobacter]PTV95174.1 flagella basal body P-ring formation protein FlgA [Rhodobacter aestuarii]SIS74704.1 flagella basal body P-ring formation protein FlgA [Rhodobacter aestuarii]SOC07654.1 flagella basal body P-ring formation protein FlgA [Rhodobacter sp. JA431]